MCDNCCRSSYSRHGGKLMLWPHASKVKRKINRKSFRCVVYSYNHYSTTNSPSMTIPRNYQQWVACNNHVDWYKELHIIFNINFVLYSLYNTWSTNIAVFFFCGKNGFPTLHQPTTHGKYALKVSVAPTSLPRNPCAEITEFILCCFFLGEKPVQKHQTVSYI